VPLVRRPASLASLVLAVGLVAGCGGSGSARAAAPSPAATPAPGASVSPCPSAKQDGPPLEWPSDVPGDLPKPPGAALGQVSRTPQGLTLVRFSTRASLREGIVFLVGALSPAGYTLGRGDAEAAEADAPFAKEGLRGVYRMVSRGPCETDWLLAVSHGTGGSPLLPMRTATTGPSPLPFG
jgi:hypothetical protein